MGLQPNSFFRNIRAWIHKRFAVRRPVVAANYTPHHILIALSLHQRTRASSRLLGVKTSRLTARPTVLLPHTFNANSRGIDLLLRRFYGRFGGCVLFPQQSLRAPPYWKRYAHFASAHADVLRSRNGCNRLAARKIGTVRFICTDVTSPSLKLQRRVFHLVSAG